MRKTLLTGLCLLLISLTFAQTEEEATILDMNFRMMEAIGQQDTDALREMLHPEAFLYIVTPTGQTNQLSGEDWLNQIGNADEMLQEWTWDEEVVVSGLVAVLWTPYEFRVGGEFQHCGTNIVNFVKTSAGWKISSVTFSVMREGCPTPPEERD